MRLVRRFGYVVFATVLVVSAAGARPVSAAPMIALPNCQGKPQVRPSSVLFACADGNFSADRLTWSGWGNATSTAVGVAQSNDCTPNCAAGHMHSYRIRVIVSGHQVCPGGQPAYANVGFAWIGASPGGSPYSMKYPCTSR
ncbi:MAG TPA: hypothetical protein VHT05_11085 [Candidatus Elarobacter sp.]|nr:hypothetical protein [Candidatus Elarobacter sp.]